MRVAPPVPYSNSSGTPSVNALRSLTKPVNGPTAGGWKRVAAKIACFSRTRRSSLPVSLANSRVIYDALKKAGIGLISALPETWLVHLIRMAEDDPKMILVRLAKEEEGVGVSAGAHFAGVKSAMLMQNHGFLASING